MVASEQTIERVVQTFRRAADANRQTESRTGSIIQLSSESGDDCMVTGDLHGQRLNFNRLCGIADLEVNSGRHMILQEVCHGGPHYPDSYACMSHLLLEDVAELKVRYPHRVHFLLSNHEMAELTDFPIAKAGRMLNLQFRAGLQEFYGSGAFRVREAYSEFLRTCPLAVRLGTSVFVCHGSPAGADREEFDANVLDRQLNTSDLRCGGPAFQLVWGRDFRYENANAIARLVKAEVMIHGHEPCAQGFHVPNDRQVILDCCGRLACYAILSLREALNHDQVVQRIRRLNGLHPIVLPACRTRPLDTGNR